MCNARPVYRSGEALALRRTGADGEPFGRLVSLTGDEAVKLGREFLADETLISDELSLAVTTGAGALPKSITLVETDERTEDGRLDFAHGVIVDLQNTYFRSERFHHRTRICVTVCQHGTKSKIWFRSHCVGFRNSTDDQWHLPINMHEEQMSAFFDEAHDIGELALNAVQNIYDTRIQPYVETKLQGDEAHLYAANRYEFRTFDSDSPKLETLYYKLKNGFSFTETLKENLEEEPDVVEPAMMAVNVALAHKNGPVDSLQALASLKADDDFSVIDHASAVGDIGIFVHQVVAETDDASELQLFSGAAYDPSADDPKKRATESPAFRVATEMLATVTADI